MLTKKEPSKNGAKNTKNTSKSASLQIQQPSNQHQGPINEVAILSHPIKNQATSQGHGDKKPGQKTRITVKYDVGFPNQLFIRGKGASLSWDKGQPLKNVKSDEWVWESDATSSHFEFKVLINDQTYEQGDNHQATNGYLIIYTPKF
jgi:hypothetical protein